MDTTEECSRRGWKPLSHEEQNALLVDRLSDLPDSVLTHILSFLLTDESVRTSILAKRWRYLWTYVPTLDLDLKDYKFIDRIMLQHKVQSIDTFCLSRSTDGEGYHPIWDNYRNYHPKKWVTAAIDRNVQTLDLTGFNAERLPRRLFTCKTLVNLTLFSFGVIPKSGTVCLPCLKMLYLIDTEFEEDESLPHLLSGCPVLEELVIEGSETYFVCCNISSPTIKRLKLEFCGEKFNRLEINTPTLVYLKIDACLSMHMELGQLTSLTEADIILYEDEDQEDGFLYSRMLLGFIDGLCNVKRLILDISSCPQIIDSVLSPWTKNFHNLTELELTADCRLLSKFLENADNLEILIFTEEYLEDIEDRIEPPQQVPTWPLSRLKIIKLGCIKGKKHEFEIIRFLLRNARVLERMEICYAERLRSEEKINNMLQEISLFPRGSTTCEVVFVEYIKRLYFNRL